ncbi:periplasmic binding protein-like I [Rhizoclosmatium globosum]|uniref:Periplasmic binding protein-like I n=1 Tax=Rhizoclosmatium globosum TaxID=329046 RepID=A0A1Y2CW97_9FUNG|nr:periplasmic binding protein-like I [Rhizoclosmatium globosum]|eukprot:ORY51302.1 periplasmic binding protein-like I [Rhizoclosmatium globosum]
MFNVDFKRFTDCGPYYYDAMDQYNGYSGGYAGSIMNNDIGNTYPDVIGVVGNEYSSTARYSAEGLSYYQIPYCSSGSVSPRLGDKQRYPYFFRAMPSRGLGNHIFQYLKTTSVTRVAMVYEKNDEMGSQFAIDIAQSMGQNGVQLICNIGLNTDFGLDELHYLKSQILQTDARYIIISGQNAFTASIYYGMASIGVYGTKYVYIGYNSPSLFDNQISQYQFNVYDAISGFIHFQQNQPDMTTELFADFYQRVLNASFLTPSDLDALTLIDNSNLGASPSFDCVMALMIGFENLVRKLEQIQTVWPAEIYNNFSTSLNLKPPTILG